MLSHRPQDGLHGWVATQSTICQYVLQSGVDGRTSAAAAALAGDAALLHNRVQQVLGFARPVVTCDSRVTRKMNPTISAWIGSQDNVSNTL